MSAKGFTLLAGTFFTLVLIGHIFRLALHWQVTVDNVPVPYWVSWVAIVILSFMDFAAFQAWKKS